MTHTIAPEDVAVIARAMASAVHQGDGEPPERDIALFHERAKLFLAAAYALNNLRPAPAPEAAPEPAPSA